MKGIQSPEAPVRESLEHRRSTNRVERVRGCRRERTPTPGSHLRQRLHPADTTAARRDPHSKPQGGQRLLHATRKAWARSCAAKRRTLPMANRGRTPPRASPRAPTSAERPMQVAAARRAPALDDDAYHRAEAAPSCVVRLGLASEKCPMASASGPEQVPSGAAARHAERRSVGTERVGMGPGSSPANRSRTGLGRTGCRLRRAA